MFAFILLHFAKHPKLFLRAGYTTYSSNHMHELRWHEPVNHNMPLAPSLNDYPEMTPHPNCSLSFKNTNLKAGIYREKY